MHNSGGQDARIARVRIEHNNVTNTAGSGIYCQACSYTSIANNIVSFAAQQRPDLQEPVGCVALNDFDHGAITGNVCNWSGKDGFGIASPDVSASVFSGNTAHICLGNGFNFRSTGTLVGLVVTGNVVDRVNGYGFNILPGTLVQDMVLTSNIFLPNYNGHATNINQENCNGGCVIANNIFW